MKPHEDAFGWGIYDFYRGINAYEVDERDDGYVSIAFGPSYYLAEYEDWPGHQKQVMSLVKGRVLDIGCGAGRNALYLEERGYEVTAIDNSPLAIKVCRLKGLKDARCMSITCITPKMGTYDTILMFGNNFGLFSNPMRARTLLRRFYRMTSDDALILAESKDLMQTADPVQKAYCGRNKKRGRMPGQLRIRIRYRTHKTPWFDYLLVSRKEMEHIVRGTGWRIREFHDSGTPVFMGVLEKDT